MNVGTYAFAQLLRVLPRTRITRAVGRLVDLELPPWLSRAVVGVYAKAYDVNLDEAEPLNGSRAYPSFDAFFTRPLRDGARSYERAPLTSPADGRLDASGPVSADGEISVKGRPYRAKDLLASDAAARRYEGGSFAVIYLSPRDYHRVHAPVAGRIVEIRSCPGDLFPVNAVSERHIPNFLVRNRRVAIELETDDLGTVTVVMVAAMIVGRVTVTGVDADDVPLGTLRPSPPLELARGDELAVFHLGSTAVLFTEPGVAPFDRPHGPIRLGEALTPGTPGAAAPAGTPGAGTTEVPHD
ncbi:MAG: archaetidylserine decarboxylase [Polyangiaceae bacterium]